MQKNVWEKEYRKPKLVTGSDKPQTSVKDFLRWLKKERGQAVENMRVLDLGCGNGKNTNYVASLNGIHGIKNPAGEIVSENGIDCKTAVFYSHHLVNVHILIMLHQNCHIAPVI